MMKNVMDEIDILMQELNNDGLIDDETVELKGEAFKAIDALKKAEDLRNDWEALDYKSENIEHEFIYLIEEVRAQLNHRIDPILYQKLVEDLFLNLNFYFSQLCREKNNQVIQNLLHSLSFIDSFKKEETLIIEIYGLMSFSQIKEGLDQTAYLMTRLSSENKSEQMNVLNFYTLFDLIALGTRMKDFDHRQWQYILSFMEHIINHFQMEITPYFSFQLIQMILDMPKDVFIIENTVHQDLIKHLITDESFDKKYYFEQMDTLIDSANEMKDYLFSVLSSDIIVYQDQHVNHLNPQFDWNNHFLKISRSRVERDIVVGDKKEKYKMRQSLSVVFTGDSSNFVNQYQVDESITQLMKRSLLHELYEKFNQLAVRVILKQATMAIVNQQYKTRQITGTLFGYRESEDYYFFDYKNKKIYLLSNDKTQRDMNKKRLEEVQGLILYIMKAVKR